MTIFITLFTLAMVALTLSTIGRMRISWNKDGITLSAFPKKPKLIHWKDLEKVSLDHLGYHVSATSGRFKIRKKSMPDDLLKQIKENVRLNNEANVKAISNYSLTQAGAPPVTSSKIDGASS